MTYWNIATEDELSEAVGKRILQSLQKPIFVHNSFRKGGYGYLKKNADKWKSLAQLQVLVLLTDLDQKNCPSTIIENWFGTHPLPEKLTIRIAIREIESWLLADHIGIRELIGNKGKLPPNPDTISDPKQLLLTLAKNAPKEIRMDLLRETNGVLRQAVGYNSRLTTWVQTIWCPIRASNYSPSLQRAINRLELLAIKFPSQTSIITKTR